MIFVRSSSARLDDLARITGRQKLLRGVLLSLCTVGGVMSPIAAATEVASHSSDQEYAIAAGRLSDVLAQFAATSGVQLVFDPLPLTGLQSPGIVGRTTVQNGFQQLLSGSGYEAVHTGPTQYVLRKVSTPASATTLAAVTVKGARDSLLTEGSDVYLANGSDAATGLGLFLRETPQTITVITSQRIEDQSMTSLSSVMNAVPGVYNEQMGTPVGGESFYYARGYRLDNLRIDGLSASPQSWSYYGAASLDTAVYDSVTVIRGATGLLTGSGDPSGSINITRKRPTDEFRWSVEGGLGSWDRRRGVFDLGGPLNEQGSVRGRFIAVHDRANSWIDNYSGKKSLGYGVLEADLSDRTLLRLNVQYDQEKADSISYSSGLPVIFSDGQPTPVDRHMNTAPDWAYKDEKRTDVSVTLEHEFTDDWKAILAYSYGNRRYHDQWYKIYEVNQALEIPDLWVGNNNSKETKNAFNAHVNGRFTLFGRQHDLVAGVNGSRVYRDMFTHAGGFIEGVAYRDGRLQFPEIDWEGLGFQAPFTTETKQYGAYLSARLRVTDSVAVILGSRWSDWEFKQRGTFQASRKEHGVYTPYVGLLFDLTDNVTLYGSYTEIFNPQSNYDRAGKLLEPETGKNYEIGLKTELFDNRLSINAAVFEARKDNLAVMDGSSLTPEGKPAYRAEDHTKGRGWELEITGELTPGWNMQAGYSRTLSRASNGERLNTQIPIHQFKLFTAYSPSALPQLKVGAGVQWQSEIYDNNYQGELRDIFTQKSYATVNLMASYTFQKKVHVVLDVNNLFDKTYRRQTGYRDYGAPRSVMATLKYQY